MISLGLTANKGDNSNDVNEVTLLFLTWPKLEQ